MYNQDKLELASISPTASIKQGMSQLNQSGLQILAVVDGAGRVTGTVTDGDVRRAILANVKLSSPIQQIANPRPKTLQATSGRREILQLMKRHGIQQVPLVDAEGRLVDIATWSDVQRASRARARSTPVFVMAGGKGTRLDPFTRILPKPMIPVGEKPILEVIMDRFADEGFTNFVISVGYKAEIIKLYFADRGNGSTSIRFVEEHEPRGTAGSLALASEFLGETFFVTNCDILVDWDYGKILEQHHKDGNDITVVGSMKTFQVPYGVISLGDGGFLGISEKPEFDYLVSIGMYVLEPHLVGLVPRDGAYHMPDLIETARARGMKVGVYPISNEWFDIGQWEEYRNTLRMMEGVRE